MQCVIVLLETRVVYDRRLLTHLAAVIVRARVNGERNVSQMAVQRPFMGLCRPGRSSWPPLPSLVTSIGATSWIWAIEVGRSSSAIEVSQRSEKCA